VVGVGNCDLAEAREKAVAEAKGRADQRAANVFPIIREIQRAGAKSLRQVFNALTRAASGAQKKPKRSVSARSSRAESAASAWCVRARFHANIAWEFSPTIFPALN
jgi:hypothetical protein